MSVCKRCGKCCYLAVDGQLVKCRYLIRVGSMYHCWIFKSRLGTRLGNGHICSLRKNSKWDYPGCPLNTDKPIHPLFRDSISKEEDISWSKDSVDTGSLETR